MRRADELPQWLMVDLGDVDADNKSGKQSASFRHVVYGYTIEISEDKKDWKLVCRPGGKQEVNKPGTGILTQEREPAAMSG